jgi:hypothetical protein
MLTEDDFSSLPEYPLARWVKLEERARDTLLTVLREGHEDEYQAILKQSYISTVSAAALKLGVSGLSAPVGRSGLDSGFDMFFRSAVEKSTQIQLSLGEIVNSYSVKVSVDSQSKIKEQIVRLRLMFANSDLDRTTKQNADELLSELNAEIERPRASMSRVMTILAFVASFSVTGVAFFADLPAAVGTIAGLIGVEKTKEPARLEDLSEEMKLLPPPLADGHANP